MECYKSLIFDCYEKFSRVKINNYRKSPNPWSKTGLSFYRVLAVFFAYTEIFAEAIVILNFNILYLHLAHVAHSVDDRFAQLWHYLSLSFFTSALSSFASWRDFLLVGDFDSSFGFWGLLLLTLSSCRLTATTGFFPHWMTDCITWTEKKMIEFWSELYELRWPALFASSTAQQLSPLFFDQSGTERFLKLHRYILLHRFPGRFVRYFAASNNLTWLYQYIIQQKRALKMLYD